MNYLIRTCLCMTLTLSFCMLVGQVHGQTVTYTITGSVNDLGFGIGIIPEISDRETFVAEFEIDLSVPDSDLSSEDRGEYAAAISSSSIVFSGGYVSQVDFAGGDVLVQRDAAGGGIFLNDADGLGSILVYDLLNPFDSDALLSDPATQFVGGPQSLFSLREPTGAIFSVSDTGLGPAASQLAFSVSAADPVLGDIDLNGVVDFSDIPPFIDRLISGEYQTEADIDQNGEVNFADIPPFVDILSVQ